MSTLEARLDHLANVPVLLVASDYDGTIAPIVADPAEAHPNRESLVALRSLAALPQTFVAIISGRSLRDLARLTGEPPEVHLVGSHGSEFDPGFAQNLTDEQKRLREAIEADLVAIAGRVGGSSVETKPASVAFHYRNADPADGDAAVAAILGGPASRPGVQTKRGKMVIELSVVPTNKGQALELVRHKVGATAVLFIGDDVTDEDAFETLQGPDVAIKVGEGKTRAPFRIRDTDDVARILARIAEARSRWLTGSEAVPIAHHSMLSDQRTIALVTPGARITWACMPRVDSPALFADLLGGSTAGHFSVGPPDESAGPTQRYVGDSCVVETTWPGLKVTDYLDCSAGRPLHRAGRSELIRVIEGPAVVAFAPRLDFGRTSTRLAVRERGLEVEDSLDPIVLVSPGVAWKIENHGRHDTAVARIDARGPIVLELRYGSGNLSSSAVPEPLRRQHTIAYWSDWAAQLTIPDVAPDLVRRSALTLRALIHAPSGAVAAAGTTSLPEHPGGIRNWDYRYCWPRDAACACKALLELGSSREAFAYLDWILGVLDACESPERLAPVYTVSGGMLGPEAEISELHGYAGSRPVRVGNAASRQVQLDVFGPTADLVASLMEQGAPVSGAHMRIIDAMVAAVAARWRDRDHGIWEVRRPRQHHVHSKVMCWLTVDRAIAASRAFLGRDRADWRALADDIRADVLEHGWSDRLGAFRATYDEDVLDASVLHTGLSGMIQPNDPRFTATVEAVMHALRLGPTVYRYRYDDGLPGREGGFHLCTAWLVESLLLIGRHEAARELFDAFAALAGPTGLLSEEYGPRTRRALGNVPQAYSHLGLINAAIALHRSRR